MHTTRKTSSFPDARGPGLCTAWTLSTSSVSSQGSISEGDPRQGRAFKSVFVPTAIVSPVRSPAGLGAAGQGSLRKARGSIRKSKWRQRGLRLERRDGELTSGKRTAFSQSKDRGFRTGLREGCFAVPNTEVFYWMKPGRLKVTALSSFLRAR